MVICLERGADLHMAQLMPLPLTVSCFIKIRLPFWYWLTRVVLDRGPANGSVCVSSSRRDLLTGCVTACLSVPLYASISPELHVRPSPNNRAARYCVIVIIVQRLMPAHQTLSEIMLFSTYFVSFCCRCTDVLK